MEQSEHPGAYSYRGRPSDSSGTNDAPSNTAPDDGTGSSSSAPASIASNDTSSGDGIGRVEGSNGGVGISAGDTDGDGNGLINANSNGGGLLGGTLDGVQVDAVSSTSLIDAHAPGLLDATVGDGSVAGVVDGVTGDGLDGLTGAIDGFQGVQVDALDGENIAEVNAPGVADATVGGAELGNLLDGGGSLLGGLTGGIGTGSESIEVNALNGDNLAEAHAPGVADATVGGAELGNILGGAELGGLLGGADLPLDVGGLTGDLGIDVGGLDIGQTLDNVTT